MYGLEFVANVTVMLSVVPPTGFSVVFENWQFVPAGSPEHAKLVIGELKPFNAVAVTVNDAVCPAEIVKVAGVIASEKSAGPVLLLELGVIAANSPCCSLLSPAVM